MASKGFRSAVARRAAALGLAVLLVTAMVGSLVLRAPRAATASGTAGYWLAGVDGGVFNYGQAPFFGSAGTVPLNSPIVGFVPTPSAAGYWMVAGDGGIFAFGDAAFHGSMGGQPLNKPITGMAAPPTGQGYWLVASDGGVFAFGEAPFYGSLASEDIGKPIVDFAVTPTGQGYWMATSDGRVYGFGDAAYYGSVGAVDLSKRIQALAPTPSGHGYWLASADGGVFAFGDAGWFGAANGQTDKRVMDIAGTSTGRGYYLVAANGQVFPFGDAKPYGDATGSDLNDRIVAMATAVPPAAPPAVPSTGIQAVDDTVAGDEDAPMTIDVLGNDKPPSQGGSLTLQSVSPSQHGRTRVAGNRVAYEPAPDYHGPDTFTYTATDAHGASSTGTVQVTLAPVNDKPDAVDDEVTITDGGPTTIDVTANDQGLGDGLKAVTVTKPPEHGELVVQPDHKLGYTPTPGFNGTDTFKYQVTDADDESSTGEVEVTIGGANHLPGAVDDSLTTRSGRESEINVTSNDDVADGVREVRFADGSGAPTDADEVDTPAGGTARRNGSKIAYVAPAGTYTGSDAFTYVVVDNNGDASQPATVRITVVRNQPPQVKNGTVAVPQDRQAVGSIAKLGWDPEKDSITFKVRSSPAGQLKLDPDGRFLYQAPSGVEVDGFSFVATDGNSESNEGHLDIKITDPQGSSDADLDSTTTTTGSSGPSSTSSNPANSDDAEGTTSTTGETNTTDTTGKPSTTQTTAESSTTQTTSKSNAQTSGKSKSKSKSKKDSNSNNRGKPTKSKKSKSSVLPLLPLLPLAAGPALAPAVTDVRRRRRRRR